MPKFKVTKILLIACLVISGCAPRFGLQGEFCDVSQPIQFDRKTAEELVATDRTTAAQIDVHNRFGEHVCGWEI